MSAEEVVDVARSTTASQTERVVRCYRAANDAADKADAGPPDPARLCEDRFLSTNWCDDGSLQIRAKLPPVEGELVMAALRRAADALYRDRHRPTMRRRTTFPRERPATGSPGRAPPATLPPECATTNRPDRPTGGAPALHDHNGTVTNVTGKAPTVPAALARAVELRDHGCVFPGCTRQRRRRRYPEQITRRPQRRRLRAGAGSGSRPRRVGSIPRGST